MDINVHIHFPQLVEIATEWNKKLDLIINNQEKIMSAISDLTTAVAAFITEESTDIAALVAQINSTSNNDPQIIALTKQITDATAAAHTAFTTATGTPLPPPTPAAIKAAMP